MIKCHLQIKLLENVSSKRIGEKSDKYIDSIMIMKLWVSIFVDMIGIIPVKLERMW